jgi:hypothetical protein
MMTEEEIDRMGKDELREELRRALRSEQEAIAGRRAEEAKKDKAMELARSARIRVENVQAIRHLARHMRTALSTNIEPNIDCELMEAVKDIDRAYNVADIIPF